MTIDQPTTDVEKLRDTIRHEFSFVSRYLENTGGPTLKIHLARLRAALETPPIQDREPSAATVPTFHRPNARICVDPYVVADHGATSADLLDRAASIMNELARRGVFTHGVIAGAADAQPDVARWFTDYDGLARS